MGHCLEVDHEATSLSFPSTCQKHSPQGRGWHIYCNWNQIVTHESSNIDEWGSWMGFTNGWFPKFNTISNAGSRDLKFIWQMEWLLKTNKLQEEMNSGEVPYSMSAVWGDCKTVSPSKLSSTSHSRFPTSARFLMALSLIPADAKVMVAVAYSPCIAIEFTYCRFSCAMTHAQRL